MSKRNVAVLLILLLSGLLSGCAGLFSQTSEPLQKIRQQWQAAADQDNAEAQFRLGQSYCCGGSPDHSTRTALQWYCRAALQGYADAQFAMANILAGKQLDQSYRDNKSAYMWYTVAAAQGSRQALVERTALARKMPAKAMGEARHWATRWTQARCPW